MYGSTEHQKQNRHVARPFFIGYKSKGAIIGFLAFLCFPKLQAQTTFSYNNQGKVTYTEVVDLAGMSEEVLMGSALDFARRKVERKKKDLHYDEESMVLRAKLTFLLYKKGFGRQPLGQVSYVMNLAAKPNRYRYIFTEFVFYPYERNRYGKFDKVSSRRQALESFTALACKNWESYCRQIDEQVKNTVFQLKLSIQQQPSEKEKNTIKKTVDTDKEW